MIAGRGNALGSVDASFAGKLGHRIGAVHPCPLAGGGIVLPKVIKPPARASGVDAKATVEPEIAVLSNPAHGIPTCSRMIAGRWHAFGSVDTGLLYLVGAADPCPFMG